MKSGTIIKTSFIVSFILILSGIYLQIINKEGAITCLIAGLIALIVFIVAAIYEVQASKQLNRSEKATWTLGLILFSIIVGLIYILISRKRITANS